MAFVGDLLSLEVPCDVHGPTVVRGALAGAPLRGSLLEDGLLIASELVTNAVRRSGGEGAHSLKVDVGRRDGNLVISVHDPGLSSDAAEPLSSDRSDLGGWGLQIIERLCVRCGAERTDGYCVWAEMAVHGPR